MIRPESIRYKLIGLALTMSFAVLIVSGISGYILYQTYITQTASRLSETAKSNSRLIDAFANYEFKHSEESHTEAPDSSLTLSLIKSAHEQFKFGQSGEFTLAKKQENQIVFLMRNRLSGMDIPDPVTFDTLEKAEPMRKALSGDSGWMIGRDYRGVEVMAAYEPVQRINLGIVAKIDMQEIQAPFIKAAAVMIALAIVISITALGIFYWVSRQISEKFEDSTQQFNRLARTAKDVIYRMSLPDGRYEYINPASSELFGLTPEEFYQSPQKIRDLMHPDWKSYFEQQWQRLQEGDVPPSYEYQIITPTGETKWIGQSNVLVTNSSGNPVAIEGIVKDLTQHKQHTQALMYEKEVAQSYLDIAGTMMLALDELGNISLLNQ
jgi:PAS domain S-box-containing protein